MSITDIDTRPRRALCFTPMETDRRLIVDAAVHAERHGFEAVIVPEGWGFDAGVILTEIALRTERIRLVAGIQSVWGRTPATLAMEAATLADVSGGRFTLGLGASTPQLVTGLHGLAFERPVARLDDTLATVRALLAGERAGMPDGRPGLRLGVPARPDVPIWLAGLGPRATALAAHHADGWFPAFIPASRLHGVRQGVAAGAAAGCELITGPAGAASTDPELAAEVARQLVGWYLTGMGRGYGDQLAGFGYSSEVGVLRAANPRPRPGRVIWPAELDAMLPDLAVFGDHATVADQLTRWDTVADLVSVTAAPGIGELVLDLVEAAAPRAPAVTAVGATASADHSTG
jgi:alkanesulfonate monooxygenase SsuD/methylene tetrahydromethanopterin reductase-like flavin-dependent oxidoreductase (luciferase family)